MSSRNECVDRAIEELERYGLRGEIIERGKHIEIAWQTSVGRRFVFTSRTSSDWRASLNIRGEVRRLLKADNVQPKQINELSFQKAMSLPKLPTFTREQSLQNDVDALTDLVFELQTQIASVQEKMNSITVVSRIEFGSSKNDTDINLEIPSKVWNKEEKTGPFREGSTQSKIFNCLTTQFRSAHDIVKESGIGTKYVATTLSKAKRLGFAEIGLRGMWRRA